MGHTPSGGNGFNPQALFPRLLHFGVSYGDLCRVTSHSGDWLGWSLRLHDLAETYEDTATSAMQAGNSVSAAHFWRLAAVYFHYAQIRLPLSEAKFERRCRSARAFRSFSKTGAGRIQSLQVPFRSMSLPGYLLPAEDGAPLVILVGGLDSAKEVELDSFAQPFLERGVQCYLFDGPGQGELLMRAPLELRFEAVLGSVVDYFAENFNPPAIGVFGVSLGGFLAARGAAADRRLRACISLGGFFEVSALAKLPPFAAGLLRHALSPGADESLEAALGHLSVADAAPKMLRPLFVIHGTEDHLVDDEQIREFEAWARPNARIWRIQGAEHVCTDRFAECLPVIADWMADCIARPQQQARTA